MNAASFSLCFVSYGRGHARVHDRGRGRDASALAVVAGSRSRGRNRGRKHARNQGYDRNRGQIRERSHGSRDRSRERSHGSHRGHATVDRSVQTRNPARSMPLEKGFLRRSRSVGALEPGLDTVVAPALPRGV